MKRFYDYFCPMGSLQVADVGLLLMRKTNLAWMSTSPLVRFRLLKTSTQGRVKEEFDE